MEEKGRTGYAGEILKLHFTGTDGTLYDLYGQSFCHYRFSTVRCGNESVYLSDLWAAWNPRGLCPVCHKFLCSFITLVQICDFPQKNYLQQYNFRI